MGKKVISFSLYGRHPQYTLGAVANARHASMAYPGWICRFYVSNNVPAGILTRLRSHGAEVINMGEHLGHEGMLWRFLPTVDPEVDITLSRDADSRFIKCELMAVNEWLASGKKFHVMRKPFGYPILGGLWGVRGGIPELKDTLESRIQSADITQYNGDQQFLRDNLYPLMKGNVYVHSFKPQKTFFTGEIIHPFPAVAGTNRGKYVSLQGMQVGMRMPSKRSVVVLSIYKRTPFSEYFLSQLLYALETLNFYHWFNIKFYVADNIRSDLIKRLRRFGKVILKSTKTTYKDDPQYWKLSVLSEKNLGAAVIVDFWQFFFLVHVSRGHLLFNEFPPLLYKRQSIGLRDGFRKIAPTCVSVSATPIANIDELVAQRNPDETPQQFIRSTVSPRISTMTTGVLIGKSDGAGTLKSWVRIVSPLWLYNAGGRVKGYLKERVFSL